MKEKKRKERTNHLQHRAMASATSTYSRTSYIFLPKIRNGTHFRDELREFRTKAARRVTRIHALSQGPTKPPKPSPGVDTRIHWDNPDEGWIGGSDQTKTVNEDKTNLFSEDKFAELIKDSFDSHYQ